MYLFAHAVRSKRAIMVKACREPMENADSAGSSPQTEVHHVSEHSSRNCDESQQPVRREAALPGAMGRSDISCFCCSIFNQRWLADSRDLQHREPLRACPDSGDETFGN